MSIKQEIEDALILTTTQEFLYETSESDSEKNSDYEDEIEDNNIVTFGLLSLSEMRYFNTRLYNIPKSSHWYYEILPSYDDKRFKKILRITSENFKILVNLISDHEIFQIKGQRKQAPVELQLAVFLHRIGGKSNIFEICSRFGISEGTVILYINRIIKAIISKKSLFVQWPKGEQRKLVHEGFQSIGGFKNIIGAIDGTHLILNDKPSNTPESYFNRKKFYSIQCQGIVDYRGIFISYDIGWPGSVHDAKVYKNSSFYKLKNELIIDDDYLFKNLAYLIFPFLITPFHLSSNKQQKNFNYTHLLYRVVVKHAFGRLKSRFVSLKGYSVKKVKHLIFYNFLELNEENWDLDLNFKDKNENQVFEKNDNNEELKLIGQQKRNDIMQQYIG